ncbi:50S ribosomal protein L29 [Candidatus Daviesbacteria bacterium RIFCSPHIGHO2_01_FULL_44_29]|uniref:Large ribosomal subunit protein uL29 n=1 Tax=Candidatus Daviesbacteria bacterium RIFCSPHIGHO2_02_FULL_43_12 TaxID=1797776 RepID=A0A1F5KGE1_9BACT|nr:MAG: 50S ribosomal protein L29 [Candidatus Daviesbacteria bacterium RIFCSPHIGHO2_01_FULL_44_29]OGE39948.1 MAG: 50S ribosomal protein L29 [Candidatus Daviesbacteria bacterium RIFCSPHIGHO2_02_FULL_43_12]OGE40495.1 MAG: 50S ribosomal protein L29 [Candidatus Daviesbacteria bacterium RIFCSPHIGHO2_12_FULL_47_45]OGE70371.1 MAG: 50S ribosomal protein L29 [Candidatus Daviesbacteria bacterium RIFCSPLOWO2_01_FULL_43_15]
MKKDELNNLKGTEVKSLLIKAKDLKKEIDDLHLEKNMNKLKNLKSISKKRKELAQVLTILRQIQLLAELEPDLIGAEKGTI